MSQNDVRLSTVMWTRLGDRLPGIAEPILLAIWNDDDRAWRVRDAALRIRFEEVVPRVSDMDGDAFAPTNWWFECIYPGKGDMRLALADYMWAPMPAPEAR